MKKQSSTFHRFEVMDRRALQQISGGGQRPADAQCNAGAQCRTWEPGDCGPSLFCYCQAFLGIIGTCKGA